MPHNLAMLIVLVLACLVNAALIVLAIWADWRLRRIDRADFDKRVMMLAMRHAAAQRSADQEIARLRALMREARDQEANPDRSDPDWWRKMG